VIPKWRYENGAWRETPLPTECSPSSLPAQTDRDRRPDRRVDESSAKGAERRTDPRLRLCYPIEVHTVDTGAPSTLGRTVLGRTVTQDLSARGAYFCTSAERPCEVGSGVSVLVTVPHTLASGGSEVSIDLRGNGRVVRIDSPARGSAGEDGVRLTGIAIEFNRPLDFSYAWM